MSYASFSSLLLANINKLIISLLISSAIYLPIMYKKKIHVFSPYIYLIYNSLAATAVMLLLFFAEKVDTGDFIFYLFAEFLFYIGFLIKIPKLSSKNKTMYLEKNDVMLNERCMIMFFSLFFLFFMLNKLLIYRVIGIPIFMRSRNSMSTKGGGTGFFLRIDSVVSFIIVYFSIYFFFIKKRHKILSISVIGIYIFTILLSASKSAFMGFVCMAYAIFLIYEPINDELLKKIKSKAIPLILLSFVFLVIGFLIQERGKSLLAVFSSLGFRLIAQGDAIFMGFPNQKYKLIEQSSLLSIFCSDLFITLRLVPNSFSLGNIGSQLVYVANGFNYDSGSVLPHQILGIIEFDILGRYLFSFCCGFIMNIIYSNFKSSKSHLINILQLILYVNAPKLNYAFPAFSFIITNIIILTLPILIAYFFIVYCIPLKKIIMRKRSENENSSIIGNL